MRTLLAVLGAMMVWSATPSSIHAWGMDVHRLLTTRALDGLPADVKPFFAAKRAFITEHAADPDLWRIVALKTDVGDEDPNHFLDIDALDDPAPFRNVPRTWAGLVEKYGQERATKAGRLPWRGEEIYNKLVSNFQDMAKPGGAPYAADNARYLVAVLSHYVEDAHQPLHATGNYDGQLTDQRGIHSRFETELVMRNWSTLKLTPVTIRPIDNVLDFMFATIVESQSLVASVLLADCKAAEGREFYDGAYYATLLREARPLLERRLSDTASGVASVVVSAWQQAGRPALPVAAPRTPARIRRVP